MRSALELLANEIGFKIPEFADFRLEGEGLTISYDGKNAVVRGKTLPMLAKSLVEMKTRGFSRPFTVNTKCAFETLGIMADVSRNAVLTVESVRKLARIAALCGYNMLQLYTEDTFTIDNRPYFGYLRGRYSKEELKEIDAYCGKLGIELIPCVQTLAHLNAITKWGAFGDILDINDILLCGEEKTYEFIEDIFRTLSGCFTSRRVNIGMDEAHMVGLGKYLKLHGYRERFGILTEHLSRVNGIAVKYGFKPMMWSDMFFRLANGGQYYGPNPVPERVKKEVPENVSLIYWDYHSTDKAHYDEMIKRHKEFGNEIWTANAAVKYAGIAPNNGYSFKTMAAFLAAQKEQGIKHTFITLWGDNGGECSVFSVLPSLVRMSETAYGGGAESGEAALKALTGLGYESFLAVDLPNYIGGLTPEKECPGKYYLYNDLFSGFLDSCYPEGFEDDFAAHLVKFSKGRKSCYGYIFKTLYDYCRALSLRLGLGIKTRCAYQSGDKARLEELARQDYKYLESALERFYNSFKRQWFAENKPQGFEVQEIRLGGLIMRVKSCRSRLLHYCAGKCESIPELEEEILPFPTAQNYKEKHLIYYNWANYVTVNTL